MTCVERQRQRDRGVVIPLQTDWRSKSPSHQPRYTHPINSSLLLTDTLGVHQNSKPAVGIGMGSDSREYQSVACRYITEKRLLQRGRSQKWHKWVCFQPCHQNELPNNNNSLTGVTQSTTETRKIMKHSNSNSSNSGWLQYRSWHTAKQKHWIPSRVSGKCWKTVDPQPKKNSLHCTHPRVRCPLTPMPPATWWFVGLAVAQNQSIC